MVDRFYIGLKVFNNIVRSQLVNFCRVARVNSYLKEFTRFAN
jgi:hypothetical protein